MQLYYAITIEQKQTEGQNQYIAYVTFIEQSLWDTRPLNAKDFNALLSDRSGIEEYINSLNLDFLTPIGDVKGIYKYNLKEDHSNYVVDHSDFLKHGLIQSKSFEEFLLTCL